ncbi:unnamed protein product [Microthlaspi erraticum]|uniref:F-box domain-containing protein n=1 Tax=Microthlaspi erraticum TaxID=1685480 RepID=A0A6D2KFN1_9BRAS|nr:unnamed protein product [Microthlaspi erraticum]
MITNLPMDLMEDILSRVPIKSMTAVRLTCTKWNTISKSQIFTKMHFDKAFDPAKEDESESRMITMTEGNLYLVSVNNFSAEKKGKLTCLEEQVKMSRVYHYDGLLLCIPEEDDTQVVVWNPYLGKTRRIELRSSHVVPWGRRCLDVSCYGIGYEDKGSGRNHKILRFIDAFLLQDGYEFFWYEIYDFETGLWTTLDVTDPHWRTTYGDGVSIKGNTYWCARERGADGWNGERDFIKYIICFDYTRKIFGPLLALPCQYTYAHVTLSCVREEKLAALCNSHKNDWYLFEIWISTRIEAGKVSWSKFFTFNEDSLPYDICFLLGSFFIDQVKKVVMFCGRRLNYHTVCINNEEGEYQGVLDLQECTCTKDTWWRSSVCSYVPSLVQIKDAKGGQREKQSDLENSRYDEMMSRHTLFMGKLKTPDFSCSV